MQDRKGPTTTGEKVMKKLVLCERLRISATFIAGCLFLMSAMLAPVGNAMAETYDRGGEVYMCSDGNYWETRWNIEFQNLSPGQTFGTYSCFRIAYMLEWDAQSWLGNGAWHSTEPNTQVYIQQCIQYSAGAEDLGPCLSPSAWIKQ